MNNMNIVVSLIFVICLAGSFVSCNFSTSKSETKEEPKEPVAVAFEASFTGKYTYVGPDTLADQKCTDPLNVWRAIVDCEGTSNVMGDLTVHFDFCGDANGNYGNTFAFMVDKKSDTLFVSCEGKVEEGRLEGHPEHVISWWKDEFEILGGTGKYKGASGKGMTNDYNSSKDAHSHHQWEGIITLRN